MELDKLKLTEKRKEICQKLGLNNSNDILTYFPYRYEEYSLSSFDSWNIGDTVTFKAELISYPSTFRYGKKSTTRFKVLFDDNYISVTIFNRPWIKDIKLNDNVVIIGRYDGDNKVTATNYYTKDINEVIGIRPIYSLKEGINQNHITKLIEYTFNKTEDEIVDILPSRLLQAHGLIDYKTALKNIHFPKDRDLLHKSLSRLKYEEFLRFYTCLSIINGANNKPIKKKKNIDLSKVNTFIESLPFELTADQKQSANEIVNDIASEKIMYRLLQGDVGSGKTAIAMIGLYANYLSGYKGALMAPTEILAKQHYQELKKYFADLGIKVEVLYSSLKESKLIKERLKCGDIDIIVGTHALFSDDIEIDNLGLVVTDEQHRFGVKQRRKIKDKGKDVDFLMMSATPIPRTLASSIYGDMDISTIETMPSGRKGCKTYLIKKNSIVDILDKIKDKLAEGRQVYIIAAAIEANENYNAKDVNGLYNSLIEALKPYNVAFLHGKMDSQSKDEVMESFNSNEVQVLVSTTVVEVGVNVKNATMMIIYDADRFGLSQLHQLRGRVQRSDYEGTCYLLTGSKDNNVLNRLETLVKSNNGFEIAYQDLSQRGPGDILGTRQAGLPSLILGNFIEDSKFIEASRKDAKEIIVNLNDEENKNFYEQMKLSLQKTYID